MKVINRVVAVLGSAGLMMALAVPVSSAVAPEGKLPESTLKAYLPTPQEASAAVGFTGTLTIADGFPDCTSIKTGGNCDMAWLSNSTQTYPSYATVSSYTSVKAAKKVNRASVKRVLKGGWVIWKRSATRVVFAPPSGKKYATQIWFVERVGTSLIGAGCVNEAVNANKDAIYQCAEKLFKSMKRPS